MVVGAKVYDLTEDLLWFVCGLYVGILTSPLTIETHIPIIFLKNGHKSENKSSGY